MKATGIVRRLDDLGRVIIPKEIRRSMKLNKGDGLEIFVDKDGEVLLKKYQPTEMFIVSYWNGDNDFIKVITANDKENAKTIIQAEDERNKIIEVWDIDELEDGLVIKEF